MKRPARIAARNVARSAGLLLPLLLTGCFQFHLHKKPPVQALPPIVDVPPSNPEPVPANLPPPVITVPTPAPTPAPVASAPPKPPPKPRLRHKKRVPVKSPEVAVNPTPEVSAIGQLSSGDLSGLLQQTANSIAATERGLNGITRSLDDQEQKTAAQIREFLKQARAALASGDADGAHTLAVKASVLLGELVR